jgi:hypothetical protein
LGGFFNIQALAIPVGPLIMEIWTGMDCDAASDIKRNKNRNIPSLDAFCGNLDPDSLI